MAVPTALPLTTPPEVMEAIEEEELDQKPDGVASFTFVVEPKQTVFEPPMAAGAAGGSVTVTVVVAALAPQLLVTV